MGNIQQTTLVLGEGITEFYFLNSLKDDYKILKSIKPDYPKNSNLEELECEIEKAIRDYQRVFCVIDMDNKKEGEEHRKYMELKKKYHQKHFVDDQKGVDCIVRFYETDRCTELFFLYYFSYTTKSFFSYDDVEKALHKFCEYEKRIKFFQKHPLHPYFKKMGGSMDNAIKNAQQSKKYKDKTDSDCSYSELGEMFDELINGKEEAL